MCDKIIRGCDPLQLQRGFLELVVVLRPQEPQMAVCRDVEQRTLLGIRMARPKCRQKRALIAVCRTGGIFDRRSMEQVVLYTVVIRYVGLSRGLLSTEAGCIHFCAGRQG
jgi:hypothetical protein